MKIANRVVLVMGVISLLLVPTMAISAYADSGSRSDADSDSDSDGDSDSDSDSDSADGCETVRGKWSSVPSMSACASPVGMCTDGLLQNDLSGDYDFTMTTLVPANDPTVPTTFFYTALSLINTDKGMLRGTDTGSIDLNPFGHGKFVSLIAITHGSGGYSNADGFLQIRGTLDFSTGQAHGDYRGEICVP